MTPQELSTLLKELRHKANLTAPELSELSGINETQISRIENNRVDYQVSQLLKYLDGLGLEIKVKKKE